MNYKVFLYLIPGVGLILATIGGLRDGNPLA